MQTISIDRQSAALPTLDEILKDDPLYLDAAVDTVEASRITGVPVATLHTLRSRGGGPVYSKVGPRVYYQRRHLLEWISARTRRSTSDPGAEAA